jgi:hypothetical protein
MNEHRGGGSDDESEAEENRLCVPFSFYEFNVEHPFNIIPRGPYLVSPPYPLRSLLNLIVEPPSTLPSGAMFGNPPLPRGPHRRTSLQQLPSGATSSQQYPQYRRGSVQSSGASGTSSPTKRTNQGYDSEEEEGRERKRTASDAGYRFFFGGFNNYMDYYARLSSSSFLTLLLCLGLSVVPS